MTDDEHPLELREGRYVSRFFFQHLPTCNIFGAMLRDGDGPWSLRYRFRHFRDDKVWDSEDVRSWHLGELRSGSDPDKAFADVMAALEDAAVLDGYGHCPVEVVMVDSDDPDVIVRRLNAMPWANGKVLDK